MAIVFETFVNNWDYVGAATGAYILTPETVLFFDGYIEFLFVLILLLALMAIADRAPRSRSRGSAQGLAAIRDDEIAAECAGVPTLRLKLVSATTMGALMAIAGVPYPVLRHLRRPALGVQPDDRGQRDRDADDRRHRDLVRPGGRRAAARLDPGDRTVTISSEVNVLIVGVLLVVFIMVAPQGIVGLIQDSWRKRRRDG